MRERTQGHDIGALTVFRDCDRNPCQRGPVKSDAASAPASPAVGWTLTA